MSFYDFLRNDWSEPLVPFWHLEIHEANGGVWIEARDGVNEYRDPFGNWTRWDWRARRLKRKWQKFCDEENIKIAKGRAHFNAMLDKLNP